MTENERVISETRAWVTKVVAGCNFCPFVAKEIREDAIHYQASSATGLSAALADFLLECRRLDDHPIHTALLIIPDGFGDFDSYLELVALAEELLAREGYKGIYQVAGFHPRYCFAGADDTDPANYTNRSMYPMLHLLREASVTAALTNYPDPAAIPEKNIRFSRARGLAWMQQLRSSCLTGTDHN
jgi:hypothetical protein